MVTAGRHTSTPPKPGVTPGGLAALESLNFTNTVFGEPGSPQRREMEVKWVLAKFGPSGARRVADVIGTTSARVTPVLTRLRKGGTVNAVRGTKSGPFTYWLGPKVLREFIPVMEDALLAGALKERVDVIANRARRPDNRRVTPTRFTSAVPIVGHSDWSGKHFRFADREITAIYDWDSLASLPEAAIVGCAAMTFTTRFDLPGVPRAPMPEELGSFIDEYSVARASPMRAAEREQVTAHGLLLAAYTARCEHCGVGGYDAEADPDSFTNALHRRSDQYLTA